MVVILQDEFWGQFWLFLQFLIYLRFGWTNFEKNWWPNCRFFDARTDSDKILYRYDPQNFWETLEAGAKKWIFSPFWLLWSKNLGTSEIEKDKKFMSKLNYSSRSNQWCNRHVNMLKHIDLAELQRSVGNSRSRWKKVNFLSFWLLWSQISGSLELENEMKSMGKLNKLRVQPHSHSSALPPPHTQNSILKAVFCHFFGQRPQRADVT